MGAVIIGGLIALLGGVLTCYVTARYQRQESENREKAEEMRFYREHRCKAYNDLIVFLNQFVQYLHPCIDEDTRGKYTCGLTLVEHITMLSQVQAELQLYGSDSVIAKAAEFFVAYNEVPSKHLKIDEEKYASLNRIVAEVLSMIRSELKG